MKKLLLILMLILIPSVYSFEAWTNPVSLCKCGVSSQELIIFNTEKANTFLIEAEGNAKSWVDITENTIYIESGKKEYITINYKVPCDASGGELILKVTPLGKESKTITQNFDVNKCQNIEVIPLDVEDRVCPCSKLDYEFKVKNTGNFQEKYVFESSKFDVEFLPSSVILSPGEQITVTAYFTPECSVYGEYNFEIETIAVYNKIKSSFKATADIARCYEYSVSAGKVNQSFVPQTEVYDMCINNDYFIPLKIENNADFVNEFELNVEGKYAELIDDDFEIKANSFSVTGFLYKPTSPGNYTILVESESQLGDVEKKMLLPFNVKDCFNAEIIVPSKIKVNSSQIPVLIRNTGSKDAEILLKSNYELSENSLTIEDEEFIYIITETPEKSKVENVRISAMLQNGDIKEKNVRLIYGTPFLYTYWWIILILVFLAVLLVIGIIKMPKPKMPKLKKPNISKKWLIVPGLIILFFVVFSLPIQNVSPNLSNQTVGVMPELKFPVNRFLRVDLDNYFNQSAKLESSDKLNVGGIGSVAYLYPKNWTGSNFLDLKIENKSHKVFYTITPPVNENYFKRGMGVYKTLGIYLWDYLRFILLTLVVLIIAFYVYKKKPKKKSKDNRLTKIVAK